MSDYEQIRNEYFNGRKDIFFITVTKRVSIFKLDPWWFNYYTLCLEPDRTLHIFSYDSKLNLNHIELNRDDIKEIKFGPQYFPLFLTSISFGFFISIYFAQKYSLHQSTTLLLLILFSLISSILIQLIFNNRRIIIKTTYNVTYKFDTSLFILPRTAYGTIKAQLFENYLTKHK